MRKKYLSALLFGALLVTSAGTFTSCKDYDDEINNLQEQIDKLATKEDMEAKLSQMQTAIDAAKKTAEEALAKAEAADGGDDNSEEIEALEKRIKALEDAKIDVDALKAEIQKMVDDEVKAQLNTLTTKITELEKTVENLTGFTMGMVTGINFINTEDYSSALDLNYARVDKVTYPEDLLQANNTNLQEATSYVFGEGLTGAFTVQSGDVNTVVDHMLVKLDPVNAVITNDMLSLVNAKAQNLSEYVNITCEAYNDNLLINGNSRSASASGIHKIGVQLKNDVDFEAFDKLVIPTGESHQSSSNCTENSHNYIAYALAVSETHDETSRKTVSDYAISMHVQKEVAANNINSNTKITSSAMSVAQLQANTINNFASGGDAANADEACCPIIYGEAFNLEVGSTEGKVMASYVVVDYDNADLSVADKVAVQTLSFSGVNTVSKSLEHNITVNGSQAIPVPMKLVTIDYTGKVQAFVFWVKASTPALMTSSFTMTPEAYVASPTAWYDANITETDYQAFEIPEKAAKYSVDLIVGEPSDEGYTPKVYQTTATQNINNTLMTDGTSQFLTLRKNKQGDFAAKISEVKYAAFNGALNLQAMREDKAYQGIIKFYDVNGTYIGYNIINVTKKLPTTMPEGFSAKTNAINNGILSVYPVTTTSGTFFRMNHAFNGLPTDGHLNLEVKGIEDVDQVLEYNNVNHVLYIADKSIINDGNSYSSEYSYEYGAIKFVSTAHGTEAPENYKVTWDTDFAIKFGCLPVDCSYSWQNGTPKVYYKEDITIGGKAAGDNFITVKDPYLSEINPFIIGESETGWGAYANTIGTNTPVKLITGDNKENEFFTATIIHATDNAGKDYQLKLNTVESSNVVLSGNVETTVVITVTDKFGHTHDIEVLKFTMYKDHSEDK